MATTLLSSYLIDIFLGYKIIVEVLCYKMNISIIKKLNLSNIVFNLLILNLIKSNNVQTTDLKKVIIDKSFVTVTTKQNTDLLV